MRTRNRLWRLVLIVAIALQVIVLPAQEYVGARKEFLTDHEVDQIREAQEPNMRIALYLHFAKLRIELLRQYLAKQKAGRSAQIHRNLEEYGRIIETIDVVIDDALDMKRDITPAIAKLSAEEQVFLVALQAMADNPQEDHFRYEFVLEDAIEITADSLELSGIDLGIRSAAVKAADERSGAKMDATMTPELKEEVTTIRKAEVKKKGKRPSLLNKGEKLKNP